MIVSSVLTDLNFGWWDTDTPIMWTQGMVTNDEQIMLPDKEKRAITKTLGFKKILVDLAIRYLPSKGRNFQTQHSPNLI